MDMTRFAILQKEFVKKLCYKFIALNRKLGYTHRAVEEKGEHHGERGEKVNSEQ